MNQSNQHATISLPRAVILGCIFVCMATTMAPAQAPSGWSLIWSDEFNQADGTLPDSTKWNYDVGGWGWGNNEIQYYTERPQNARVLSGMLLIEARRETFGGRNHTSARLLTKGKHQWTYGRFEARIKVPRGAGLWPAFWMLGSEIDQVGWPNCGEIDIMEHVGRLPDEVFGTVHGPGYSAGNSVGRYYTLDAPVADEFHTYAVEWEPGEIRWFIDDTHYFTVNPSSLNGNAWVFDRPHFLLLNLAIDGNFAGPLDPSVEFPQQLWIDYVRVYQRDAGDADSLLNGGFELGNTSHWNGYAAGGANNAGIYVESTSSTYYNGGSPGGDPVQTRSGNFVGKIYGDFIGSENYNGCYQDITAIPDSEWQADGWAMSHPQDLMSGQNQAWIEVTFRDDEDRVLSLYRSKVMTAQELLPGQWQRLSVNTQIDPQSYITMGNVTTLKAPADTSKLRYQLVFRQATYDGGSMYFDDLSLRRTDVAPDLTSPDGGIQIARGDLVNWQADDAEAVYQLEKWTDGSGWQPLSPELFGKLTTNWFSPDTNGSYRVIRTRDTVRDVLQTSASRGVQISWQTDNSSDYQLQKSSDLLHWQNHGPAWSGDGGNATIPDSLESKVFYRLQQTGR